MRFFGVTIAVGLVVATLAVVAQSTIPPTMILHPKGNSSLAAATAFSRYPLYFPGERVGTLPLTAVDRQVGPGLVADERGVDRVSFIYGSCQARADAGRPTCVLPLEVQIWPACYRHPSVYPFAPDEALMIRGAPARFYEGGSRLEITIGRVIVVIFGRSRDVLLEAADALRGVNNALSETHSFPGAAVLTGC